MIKVQDSDDFGDFNGIDNHFKTTREEPKIHKKQNVEGLGKDEATKFKYFSSQI